LGWVLGVAVAAGCAHGPSQTAVTAPAAGWVVVPHMKLVAQRGDADCGPAALAMALGRWGAAPSAEAWRPRPAEDAGRGATAGALRDEARRAGFRSYVFEGSFEDLAAEIVAGRPVVVGLVRLERGVLTPHFAVVVGHDAGMGRWLLADPAMGVQDLTADALRASGRARGGSLSSSSRTRRRGRSRGHDRARSNRRELPRPREDRRGGMGDVYLAEHPVIGRKAALKVIHPQHARNADVVARFVNEASAISRIGHEHIVEVTDFGRAPSGDFYFIMEYLEGVALADLIAREAPLQVARALAIAAQIADALTASHAHGVIHRDLKPENVFLVTRGEDQTFVKVLDFGLAKLLHEDGAAPHQTRKGIVMGTPFYMSPSSARARARWTSAPTSTRWASCCSRC